MDPHPGQRLCQALYFVAPGYPQPHVQVVAPEPERLVEQPDLMMAVRFMTTVGAAMRLRPSSQVLQAGRQETLRKGDVESAINRAPEEDPAQHC